jgi:hypothetical protein
MTPARVWLEPELIGFARELRCGGAVIILEVGHSYSPGLSGLGDRAFGPGKVRRRVAEHSASTLLQWRRFGS